MLSREGEWVFFERVLANLVRNGRGRVSKMVQVLKTIRTTSFDMGCKL